MRAILLILFSVFTAVMSSVSERTDETILGNNITDELVDNERDTRERESRLETMEMISSGIHQRIRNEEDPSDNQWLVPGEQDHDPIPPPPPPTDSTTGGEGLSTEEVRITTPLPPTHLIRLQNQTNKVIVAILGVAAFSGGLFLAFWKPDSSLIDN